MSSNTSVSGTKAPAGRTAKPRQTDSKGKNIANRASASSDAAHDEDFDIIDGHSSDDGVIVTLEDAGSSSRHTGTTSGDIAVVTHEDVPDSRRSFSAILESDDVFEEGTLGRITESVKHHKTIGNPVHGKGSDKTEDGEPKKKSLAHIVANNATFFAVRVFNTTSRKVRRRLAQGRNA